MSTLDLTAGSSDDETNGQEQPVQAVQAAPPKARASTPRASRKKAAAAPTADAKAGLGGQQGEGEGEAAAASKPRRWAASRVRAAGGAEAV